MTRTAASVIGAVLVTAACTRDSDGAAKRAAVPAAAPLGGYRVVYRVQEPGGAREEHVVVRRPYESKRTSTRDGSTISGILSNEAGLWHWFSTSSGAGWQLVDPGRRLAEADPRPLGSLLRLLDHGLAVTRGSGRVLGRPCSVVRIREPIGQPVTEAPSATEYDELCLDATGVVLRETWVLDGRTVRTQEAVEFDIGAVPGAGDFEPVPPPAAESATIRRPVPVTESVLGGLEVTFDLPDDVVADGAAAWFDGSAVYGSVHRFFRRGDDVVDVEEVETTRTVVARGSRLRTPVGDGILTTDLHHTELRVALDGGTTVVLRASTVELARTMAAAMRLGDRP